jgi:fatty acid desaturase
MADDIALTEVVSHRYAPSHQQNETINNKRGSMVLFDQSSEGPIADFEEFEKIGSSTKWDHHITGAIVFTIIAAVCFNPLAFGCGIASVCFAVMARKASINGEYEKKLENERISFAFLVVSMIILIITFCLVGFAVYIGLCGLTGSKCVF